MASSHETPRLEAPFRGLECAEPSAPVRRRILAVARATQLGISRRRRRPPLAAVGAALGACLALLLAGTVGAPDRPAAVSGGAPQGAVSGARTTAHPPRGAVELRAALQELRADLEDIDTRARMIGAERWREQYEIRERVKACFLDVERLERELTPRGAPEPEGPRKKKEERV